MIYYKEVDSSYLELYEKIPMLIDVNTVYRLDKINNGLDGIQFRETAVEPYVNDMGRFEMPSNWVKEFNIKTWGFFMAFDDNSPIGAATVAYRTKGLNMLDDRKDMTVLWDIRVSPEYKHKGVGSELFAMAVKWSTGNGCKQMKIETQNNNVPACKFYAKQGCSLGQINEYAYYNVEGCRDEVMLIWYLDLE